MMSQTTPLHHSGNDYGDVDDGASFSSSSGIPPRATVLRQWLVMSCGVMWWYIYAAVQIWRMEGYEYRGLVWSQTALRYVAVFVFVSQCVCLGFLWHNAFVKTLRKAQFWNLMTNFVCVVADGFVVLLNPANSKLKTVVAFAIATMFGGTLMVHYLREAAFREDHAKEKIQTTHDPIYTLQEELPGHVDPKPGIFQTMIEYRPTRNFGSVFMAIRLSKAFVSFVVVLDAMIEAGARSADNEEEQQNNPWLFTILGSVMVHTSMEVILRTILPGIDVHSHATLLILHMVLYLVHMLAASVVADESFMGDTEWDNLVNNWLFASGNLGFVETLMALLEHVDMDSQIGLRSMFDKSEVN